MNENKLNIHYMLIRLIVCFGLLFVFVLPPFQLADEDSHFKKAFLIAHFNLFPDSNNMGEAGSYIPNDILEFESQNRYMIGDIEQKYSYSQFYYNNSGAGVNHSDSTFVQYSTLNANPMLYIPQAAGMLVMRLISWLTSYDPSPAIYMYAGRIGNLMCYLFLFIISIKLIPFYKRLLFFIAIMPMSLSIASSLSYDAMVIGVSILFISIVLYYAYDPKVNMMGYKEVLYLSILSIVLIELKQVYFPLILLLILIPGCKFLSLKDRALKMFSVLGAGILGHLIWMLISNTTTVAMDSDNNVKEQLLFILENPLDYLIVLGRTITESSWFYANSFVGNLGWLDTNFPPIVIHLYLILLLLLGIFDNNKSISINIKQKCLIILIFILIFILIETSLYLIWTSIPEIGGVGHYIVSGVQGRYFIPIAIVGLMILYTKNNNSVYKKMDIIIDNMAFPLSIFVCSMTLFLLLIRYWIPV